MTSDERGHFADTLVILIFVYLSGAVTGIVITACWKRHTSSREEPEELEPPLPPPPVPDPSFQTGEVRVVVPPPILDGGNYTCMLCIP